MRKRNVGIVLAAAAMLLQLVGAAAPAMAQAAPDVVFNFSPTSGPAGTKINFTGSGCPHDATKLLDGVAFLTNQGSSAPVAQMNFSSDASGNFTAQVDTTGLAPAQYVTFVVCANTSKGGPGSL